MTLLMSLIIALFIKAVDEAVAIVSIFAKIALGDDVVVVVVELLLEPLAAAEAEDPAAVITL